MGLTYRHNYPTTSKYSFTRCSCFKNSSQGNNQSFKDLCTTYECSTVFSSNLSTLEKRFLPRQLGPSSPGKVYCCTTGPM